MLRNLQISLKLEIESLPALPFWKTGLKLRLFSIFKHSNIQTFKPSNFVIFQSFNFPIFQFLIVAFLFSSFSTQAQDELNNDPNVKDLIQNIAEDSQSEVDYTALLEDLEYYKKHPLNINTASVEELEQLHYLSPVQIIKLIEHIKQNGKLLALEELQTIDAFDLATVNKITPYVTVGEAGNKPHVSLGDMLKNGDNTITLRASRILEPQQGYIAQSDSTADSSDYYLGDPNLYCLQYKFNYQNRVRWGFLGDKDPGEEFFTGTQPQGFDFYSAHFYLKNFGIIKALAIGDYNADFGQGLTMWSGLVFQAGGDISRTRRSPKGITPYTSRTESFFLRGAAVTIGIKNFELTAFVSRNKVDVSVDYIDSLGNLVAESDAEYVDYSINTYGYHRTYNELENKRSISQDIIGGNLRYKTSAFSIGVTGSAFAFDITQSPFYDYSAYNQFYSGYITGSNIGVDYNYIFHNFNFYGEISRSMNNEYAAVSGILASIDKNVSLSLFYRNLSRGYIAMYSNPFRYTSSNTNTQGTTNALNEEGWYVALEAKPHPKFTIYGHMDVFAFPWLKSEVNAPSRGGEEFIQLTYTPSKKIEMYFRYRNKRNEKNIGDELILKYTEPYHQQTIRFNVRYTLSDAITLDGRFEQNIYKEESSEKELGYVLYQDISYSPQRTKVSFVGRFMLFDTDSYDSRLYTYENDFFYFIPAFYDKGLYSYLLVNYDVVRHMSIGVKIGRLVYTHKDVISSGLDEIEGNAKTTLKAQLKISF